MDRAEQLDPLPNNDLTVERSREPSLRPDINSASSWATQRPSAPQWPLPWVTQALTTLSIRHSPACSFRIGLLRIFTGASRTMGNPRVSIGLPVYNGEDFLETAVESILAQDYKDFELIISDNASQDRTAAICQQFCRRDARIRYYRGETNRGAAWNYNRVFELSSGSLFKWQAHDDVCLPRFLSRCVETFDQAPSSVVLVYPKAEIIDASGNPDPRFESESLETRNPAPHRRLASVLRNLNMACAVFGLMRSSTLQKTRLIGQFVASDYVLLAELAMLGEIWEVPETLFQRRVHAKISTYANRNPSDLLRWYDPSKRPRGPVLSPMITLGGEYLRSIGRLPLDGPERLRCRISALAVWYERELRNLGGKYKARLKHALR